MPYYMIKWNAGYGESVDIIEATDEQSAEQAAYDAWRDEAESGAEYSAETPTSESCEEHGFDPEDYGLPPVEYDE